MSRRCQQLSPIILGVLATVCCVHASKCPVLDVAMGGDLKAVSSDNAVHYICNGLTESNSQTIVEAAATPAAGASTSFHIEVLNMRKTEEAQFTTFYDAILRWTYGGTVATWVVWEGRFVTLGSSKILAGSGQHSVVITGTGTAFTVIEDGRVVGSHPHLCTAVVPKYTMKVSGVGAVVDVSVRDISVLSGSKASTAAIVRNRKAAGHGFAGYIPV